jgi:glycosyltransferase involved in cell wall biosynthesis
VRVLTISSLWPPHVVGGAELYAQRLAAHLSGRGHEVGVVTLGVDGDDIVRTVPAWPYRLDEYVGQPPWKRALFHGRDLYDPVSAVSVRRAVRQFRPDVVHSHSVAGLSAAALTAPSALGVAHVHHLHDYWLLCQRSSFTNSEGVECEHRCAPCVTVRAARRVLLRHHGPHALIAPSAFVARAHEPLEWTRGRIEVLHLPHDDAAHVARSWSPGDDITFGYLGQLSVAKGVPTLLQAFARVAGTGARLLVAGRGALENDIAGEGVTALGWIDAAERDRFWRSIDCLVVPSEWPEPGGTVAVEARAHGLPVIAADSGGMVEAVEDASRPLIFPPGNVGALVTSLQRVAADPRAYRPATTSTWPSWDEHAERVERVYRAAIERTP